ncbi:MAG: hypothetical protein RLZZ234_282 [Candidatus Parcubacteria bacterium]|jgi:predicted patatin/cPLA2 family phospholipase
MFEGLRKKPVPIETLLKSESETRAAETVRILEAKVHDLISSESKMSAFHRERFLRITDAYNKRWFVRLGLANETTPELHAYEEALKENKEFDARERVEYERWQESLRPVLQELDAVTNDKEGTGKGKRPLLLIMGGGMKGAYSAGQVLALEKVGYNTAFTDVVGISAGSCAASYLVAGQGRTFASLLAEKCSSKELFDPLRVTKMIDTGVVAEGMRHGEYALDMEALRASPTGLHMVVTNQETGLTECLDAKESPVGVIDVCDASSTLPFFRPAKHIDGKKYIDGALGELSLETIIEKYNPTSILVLPNRSFSEFESSREYTVLEKVVIEGAQFGSAGKHGSLEDVVRMKEYTRNMIAETGKSAGVHVGVLWNPETGLSSTTINKDELKRGMLESYNAALADIGTLLQAEPERQAA